MTICSAEYSRISVSVSNSLQTAGIAAPGRTRGLLQSVPVALPLTQNPEVWHSVRVVDEIEASTVHPVAAILFGTVQSLVGPG